MFVMPHFEGPPLPVCHCEAMEQCQHLAEHLWSPLCSVISAACSHPFVYNAWLPDCEPYVNRTSVPCGWLVALHPTRTKHRRLNTSSSRSRHMCFAPLVHGSSGRAFRFTSRTARSREYHSVARWRLPEKPLGKQHNQHVRLSWKRARRTR